MTANHAHRFARPIAPPDPPPSLDVLIAFDKAQEISRMSTDLEPVDLDAKVLRALREHADLLEPFVVPEPEKDFPLGSQANLVDLVSKWGPKILAIIKMLIDSGVLTAG